MRLVAATSFKCDVRDRLRGAGKLAHRMANTQRADVIADAALEMCSKTRSQMDRMHARVVSVVSKRPRTSEFSFDTLTNRLQPLWRPASFFQSMRSGEQIEHQPFKNERCHLVAVSELAAHALRHRIARCRTRAERFFDVEAPGSQHVDPGAAQLDGERSGAPLAEAQRRTIFGRLVDDVRNRVMIASLRHAAVEKDAQPPRYPLRPLRPTTPIMGREGFEVNAKAFELVAQ